MNKQSEIFAGESGADSASRSLRSVFAVVRFAEALTSSSSSFLSPMYTVKRERKVVKKALQWTWWKALPAGMKWAGSVPRETLEVDGSVSTNVQAGSPEE